MLLGKCVRRKGERFADPCECGGYFAEPQIFRSSLVNKARLKPGVPSSIVDDCKILDRGRLRNLIIWPNGGTCRILGPHPWPRTILQRVSREIPARSREIAAAPI